MMKVGLGLFGIPSECSFNETSTFCYNDEKVVTFAPSTMRLIHAFPVNGNNAIAKMIITHDNGKSCFETGTDLVKE